MDVEKMGEKLVEMQRNSAPDLPADLRGRLRKCKRKFTLLK